MKQELFYEQSNAKWFLNRTQQTNLKNENLSSFQQTEEKVSNI